jgi:nucleotide-binding universal stress UspA family protein
MKTIAVLTDFSKRAENAARYALHLAEHLHANIKLYHSFMVPANIPMSGEIVWPMKNFEELKTENMHQLKLFGAKLKNEYSTESEVKFKPEIEYECHGGDFTSYLKMLETENDMVLLVMGNHEKGMSSWLMGNHVNELMDNVTLPVLVINEKQKFTKINKIAFATDLSIEDIEQIHSLAGLASAFNAEIVIVHATDENYNEQESQEKVNHLLASISTNVNFSKIYYRQVKSSDAENGLNWYAEHVKIDMLVMVHHHQTFLQKVLGGSLSKKIAKKIELPLLIYPAMAASVPVF